VVAVVNVRHSCEPLLGWKLFFKMLIAEKPDAIYCLGDVVGYEIRQFERLIEKERRPIKA
jgi:hypothetical protein